MKKILISSVFLLAAGVFSNVLAQTTPPGAGDKDLRDTNVKGRSNELERIDRESRSDANKKKGQSAVNPTAAEPEDKLAAKFGEIKTDYEQIQVSQDSIIKTYQSGGKIDYEQIGRFSQEINKCGSRLMTNLFPVPVAETSAANNDGKSERDAKKPKSVRDLIVELDNAVGSFTTSAMFQNLRVIDPTVSEKARLDLEKIIELSGLLDAEAAKTAGK